MIKISITFSETVREGAQHYKQRLLQKMFTYLEKKGYIASYHTMNFTWIVNLIKEETEDSPAIICVTLKCEIGYKE